MKKIVKIMLVLSIAAILGTALGCDNDKKKDDPKTYLKGGDPATIPGRYVFNADYHFGGKMVMCSIVNFNLDGTYSAEEFGSGIVVESGTWGTSGNELIFHPSGGGEFFWYWEGVQGESQLGYMDGMWVQSSDWPASGCDGYCVNKVWVPRK